MPKRYPVEFVYQALSLIVSVIVVHAFYVAVVRPRADALLAEQVAQMQIDPDYVQERSVWFVIRDFEQEACFVLMLWAIAILGYKGLATFRQQKLLEYDLLGLPENLPIGPEDSRDLAGRVQSLPVREQDYLLPRALLTAIERFGATRNVQDVSTAARDVCDSEGERLESELSTIRYIAWAIPSIGFIGTVRGIGEALAQADKAVQGDIAGVTQSLGVAFNSTFIALLISIFLMFLVYQLQLLQERLVFDTQAYCDDKLIRHLRAD